MLMHARFTAPSATLVALLLCAATPAAGAQGDATAAVRATVDEVLTVLRDPALRGPAHAAERRARIRASVLERFGFEEMAQRSLGPAWQSLRPPQRKEFVALFTDLLERSYIGRVEGYQGGPIRYDRETEEGDRAEVHSTIVGKAGDRTVLQYRLRRASPGGSFQVYDLVVDGVSLVNNYRVQFNRIVQRDGYAGLMERMRSKLEAERADERSTL